jgi:uncharacterized protein YfaP (DUF2135 family)
MLEEITYRAYLIEPVEHSKTRKYFGVFSPDGKHLWNCNTKKSAKKLVDLILDEGYDPFDFSNRHLLNE